MDPWNLMSTSIRQRCDLRRAQEALAYLEQAKDLYRGAVAASVSAARPLLLYYCFMNLAKAYCLVEDPALSLLEAKHGLSEKMDPPGRELLNSYLELIRK